MSTRRCDPSPRRAAFPGSPLRTGPWIAAGLLLSACSPKQPSPEHRDAAAPPPGSISTPAPADTPAAGMAPADSSAAPDPGASAAPVDPWRSARERGVAFRAIGQEPGWSVEIWDNVKSKRAVFQYAYGESTLAFDPVRLTVDTSMARAVYRGESGGRSIAIELRDGPCHDTMSGESFETAVSVTFDERTFQGCGRSLR